MTESIILATVPASYYRVGSQGSVSYATTRGGDYILLSATFKTGQSFVTPNWFCFRAGLKFDTSIIGSDIVSDVKMRLVCTEDYSGTDFDVHICEQDWSAQDPFGAGNQEAFFDNCLAETNYFTWRNTSGMSLNTQYTSPSMNASYVNRSGSTYYSFRSSRDYGNTAPTGEENIVFGKPDNANSNYRPVLIVTHAPAVSSNLFIFFS